ncbi:MAG: helix-turn-helix transcriptional regulator [Synergistaceae bacterium]|nr:helix-turn-helix transcriptional regulator [Synergistaceae bacterium]
MDRAFGNTIRSLREELNLTQADLAKATGLSQSAISRLEDGSRWPRKGTLLRVCNAFKLTIDELFSHATNELRKLRKPDAKRWNEYEKEDEGNE